MLTRSVNTPKANHKLDEDVEKRVDLMEEAEEDIRKAMCLISKAVAGTGRLESSVNVYLLGWLRMCVSSDTMPSHEGSIPMIIKRLKET